ncbi:MAG: preprotein translocase subunit SecD [Methanomicrobiales archaeon]
MNKDEIITLVKDWRVALLIILVVASLIAIYPHFENGEFKTNLQYGLDLQKGAWLQLEFKSEVVGFQTDKPAAEFIAALKNQTDAEIFQAGDKLEIRKLYTQAELTPIFEKAGGKITSYQQGVSKATADDVKRILESKINSLGTRDARINTLTGLDGVTRYIRVELAGVTMSEAQQVVGKQGKFEVRVVTTGNQSEHVVFGDSITGVGNPTQSPPGSGKWGVSFTMSEDGAKALQTAAIQYGAVADPDNHELQMLLDGKIIYSAPLSKELAGNLQHEVVRQLIASTGAGTTGQQAAQNLEIHLRNGALPVDVSVAGSGSVSATLGEHFKVICILAGLLALLTVGLVVFYRYREPAIVLPMVCINASEIIILLGISVFTIQLDLATIAGLIAVLGTGIDQLIIITDEILHEGKVPSPNIYQKRLSRALSIIVASAATVVIAMLPLALMDLSSLRGFAIITILGVLIGVTITRPAYGRIIMAILSK